jgi:hypothetical protein
MVTSSTQLLGNFSSTQSAIIVPRPGTTTQYYIFTVDAYGWANKVRWTIVDMSLNGGIGGILSLATKNQKMPFAVGVSEPVAYAEKITAVPKSGGIGFWLIAHAAQETSTKGNFVVWDISCNGIGNGVYQAIGTPIVSFGCSGPTCYDGNTLGYMKASRNNDKVACANQGQQFVEVFDFDNTKGILSNNCKSTNVFPGNSGNNGKPYGVEFSTTGRYVYVSDYWGKSIYRYDLSTSNVSTATLSAPLVIPVPISGNNDASTPTYYTIGALQMGPNGIMYGAYIGKDHIFSISNMEDPTAPVITEYAIKFSGSQFCSFGLPNFVSTFLGNVWINVTQTPCATNFSYTGGTNLPNAT